MSLTELQQAYTLLEEKLLKISYKEFEDLIYEMKKENYKMIAVIENETVMSYIGLKIETNLKYKKHLHIYELIINNYQKKEYILHEIIIFLIDYAKIHMCEIILIRGLEEEKNKYFIQNNFKLDEYQLLTCKPR